MTAFENAINTLFGNVYIVLQAILAAVAIVCVAWGGFLWLTSGGNPRRIEFAKATLAAGAIGMGIVLLAPQIVAFIQAAIP